MKICVLSGSLVLYSFPRIYVYEKEYSCDSVEGLIFDHRQNIIRQREMHASQRQCSVLMHHEFLSCELFDR